MTAIDAADTLMAVLGWTRVECDTCGHGVFARTDDGDLCCRMCGEKRTDHRDECGESKPVESDGLSILEQRAVS